MPSGLRVIHFAFFGQTRLATENLIGQLTWKCALLSSTLQGFWLRNIELFLGEVSPQNFPWNRPIFLRICPENPSKFDFFLLKSREIDRFFCEFWLFSREIGRFLSERWLFFREIGRFFREFAHKNPAKFCFFPRSIRSPDFNTNLQLSSYSLLHNC